MDKDFILYIDTDSLFIPIEQFLLEQGITKDQWDRIPDKEKIVFVKQISKIIEKHVDSEAYLKTQRETYNSLVERDTFSIGFKQEIVCKNALFIKKKKYGYYVVDKEGVPCNKIEVTGLEIIRSETPSIFRTALKKILEMILKNYSDEEIVERIEEYRETMANASPENLSSNIGIGGLSKYIVDNKPIKGTPWHVKGVANYHLLLKELDIHDKYEKIIEGDKAKVVYVKPNPWGFDVLSYYTWPPEFTNAGLQVDFNKQYEKFFLKKVAYLLEPQNRERILNTEKSMEIFF